MTKLPGKPTILRILKTATSVRQAATAAGVSKHRFEAFCTAYDILPGEYTQHNAAAARDLKRVDPLPEITVDQLRDALESSPLVGIAAKKLGCNDQVVRRLCAKYGIGTPKLHLVGADPAPFVPWPVPGTSFEDKWQRAFGDAQRYRDRAAGPRIAAVLGSVSRNSMHDGINGRCSMRSAVV